ncbi:MAG: rhodanese-like domain-containing protein [Tissierellia bacterium]|nr:rhodanese-like domain-containing protein [Tissierellia bacterium]
MGIFDFLRGPNIEEGLKQFKESDKGLLIDVRDKASYKAGHIPGAKNLPLDQLSKLDKLTTSKDQPLFFYCTAGNMSRMATAQAQSMGYTQAHNIGGITSYKGPIERA